MADISCTIKQLPPAAWQQAARDAVAVNPANAPAVDALRQVAPEAVIEPQHLALLTAKYWGAKGVKLTVGFLDNPPTDLRKRILAHMNAWGAWANTTFIEATTSPQVRIARIANDGYWSYLGTDVLQIPAGQPTLNLDSFTMNTPDSEFYRVVRHETGHTLGFPHEHMRQEIIAAHRPCQGDCLLWRHPGLVPGGGDRAGADPAAELRPGRHGAGGPRLDHVLLAARVHHEGQCRRGRRHRH